MQMIHLALTLGLILLNLAGLTLIFSRYLPPALARVTGILALTLPLFALEHMVGLGKLAWLWPFTSLLSAGLLYRQRNQLRSMGFLSAEVVFLCCFAYALAWRFLFPNIDSLAEKLTDLYFISNYLPGATLPPQDRWFAGPYLFDFYYAYQHYVAALIGRIFSLEPGFTMNIAWCLLVGMIGSLAWFVASRFIAARWVRGVLVAALLAGGNGLTPLMPFLIDAPAVSGEARAGAAMGRFWEATRFSGMSDEKVNTPLGQALFPRVPGVETMDIPLETISFYAYLGDYHPPLGGFALMLYALGLMAANRKRPDELATEAEQANAVSSENPDQTVTEVTSLTPSPAWSAALLAALIGASPVVTLVTNAWALPPQALLVMAWLVYQHFNGGVNFKAFFGGAAIALMLCFPFLSHFAPGAVSTPIRSVAPHEHTQLNVFLALHWPVLLLLLGALWLGFKERWAWYLALVLLVLLGFSEFLLFQDAMGGKFARFNTTIKWWSWIWPTALIGLGSMLYGLGNRFSKAVVLLIAFAVLSNVYHIANYWLFASRVDTGKLAGTSWLNQDATHANMLSYLKNASDGVVLEGMQGGAYNNTSAFSLFAGKPMFLGWPSHEGLWRGGATHIGARHDEVNRFYAGTLENPTAWLEKNDIQYILWTRWDEAKGPQLRAQIDQQIAVDYYFRAFEESGSMKLGIWERRPPRAARKTEGQ